MADSKENTRVSLNQSRYTGTSNTSQMQLKACTKLYTVFNSRYRFPPAQYLLKCVFKQTFQMTVNKRQSENGKARNTALMIHLKKMTHSQMLDQVKPPRSWYSCSISSIVGISSSMSFSNSSPISLASSSMILSSSSSLSSSLSFFHLLAKSSSACF